MADCKIGPETRERIAGLWPKILASLAGGDLVRDVLKQLGLSNGELRAYRLTTEGAQAEWDAAREDSAHEFMEEALHIARSRREYVRGPDGEILTGADGKPLIAATDAALARVQVDALKWAARIRNPRLYGDKAQLDVNVRTVDLTRIIEAANARLLASQAGRVIEQETLKALL